MKFTLNNDHQADRLMNTLLSGHLVFTLLFLGADIVLKMEHYGSSCTEIATTFYGDEAAFIDPLPFATLLESLHADIFFAMMVLLTLGAVYGRVGRSRTLRIVLINGMMLGALVALVSPLLAYYLSPVWLSVWIVAFWIWHVGAIAVAALAFWRLRFP